MRILTSLMSTMAIAFLMTVLALGGLVIAGADQDYVDCIKANRDVVFPEEVGFTVIFGKNEGASFHGDGLRYHVFAYDEQTAVESMLLWEEMNAESKYDEAARRWMDSLEIPPEQRPDCTVCKCAYMSKNGRDEILFLWDAGEKRIYTIESFM